MPTSRPTHLAWLGEQVLALNPKSILDVGIGFGGKGMLFRELTDVWNGRYDRKTWETRIDGIEIFPAYVGDLQKQIYSHTYIGDALEVLDNLDIVYDLIYAGDILEHFEKVDGIKFIKKLKERGRTVIIVTPKIVSKQGAGYGNIYEMHRSQWNENDLPEFEIFQLGNMIIAVYGDKPRVYYCEAMSFFGERMEKLFGYQRYDHRLDQEKPLLFIGLYFAEDYQVFVEHQGLKTVFWNGVDVSLLKNNPIWLRMVKIHEARHVCHNEQLQSELKATGIDAEIHPLFFGDTSKYPVSFKPSNPTHVYMNTHPGREDEYGVPLAVKTVSSMDGVRLHIYGVDGESTDKVLYHGQVPEEIMDQETKDFQGCLQLATRGGFAQTVMKAILLGQYPILYRPLLGAWQATNEQELIDRLELLKKQTSPNMTLREQYVKQISDLTWLKDDS